MYHLQYLSFFYLLNPQTLNENFGSNGLKSCDVSIVFLDKTVILNILRLDRIRLNVLDPRLLLFDYCKRDLPRRDEDIVRSEFFNHFHQSLVLSIGGMIDVVEKNLETYRKGSYQFGNSLKG